MPKVEITFPGDFESDEVGSLHLGRLNLGGHIGRLEFTPSGKLIMIISEEAIKDGSIVLHDFNSVIGYGASQMMEDKILSLIKEKIVHYDSQMEGASWDDFIKNEWAASAMRYLYKEVEIIIKGTK